MSHSSCSEKLTRIYEYLDGALSCEDLQELQNHLAECHDCAQEYDLECVIRSVVKRSCRQSAPSDLKARILGTINNLKQGHILECSEKSE
ncbi:mycothiol system anti-sigma-R factor [Rothia sp. P6271]|uniref:mycothiol system anti-sigma-R factor n=1 Tax=unclassified Rothia (in: high G+C Gram-positive bacteria) TaxID=2689056 RepID=UPI003AC2C394